jgi:cysteine-rich repeat protein
VLLRVAGLQFADPARADFRLDPASPGYGICGARAPGAADMWALRVLHHDPYLYGDSWKAGTCGDGVVQRGEDCDDGNTEPDDGCTADCELDAELDGLADPADNCPALGNAGQEDRDRDGIGDACDLCPDLRTSDQADSDGNGIGDACECGDANGDGRVDVFDVVAVMHAIFDPTRATALCDTNDDQRCDIADLKGVQYRIYGAPAYCSAHPRPQ